MQESSPNSLSSQDLPVSSTQLAQSDREGSDSQGSGAGSLRPGRVCGTKAAVRCKQRTRAGHPCQLRVRDTSSGLCFRHAGLRDRQMDPDDLSADLLDKLTEFHSPYEVNEFLARLLFLLVRNRISSKRAGVLTYIAAQLLSSLREVRHGEDSDDEPVTIIMDAPRPDRSQEPDYSPPIQRT
jgi:hypothetical protein